MKTPELIFKAGICSAFVLMAAGSLTLAQPAKSSSDAESTAPTPVTGVDSPASAHGSANPAVTVMKQPPLTPANFVSMASADGMAEVEAAKLALSKAKSPEVRSFAQQMVRDHERANAELKTIAAPKGLNVATSLNTEHQQMLNELNSKNGTEFDAAYVQQMNAAHAKAVALFQQAALSSDADIAMFASKMLPTLHAHHKMAMQLKKDSTAAGKTATTD